MNPKIQAIERSQLKTDLPHFRAGDTVRVFVRIAEEEKTRIQPFEGVVIARRGGSVSETFTVRRVSYGEGVERCFFLHSPMIEKIQVIRSGHVRRAKLFYLRTKIGKGTRIPATERGGSAGHGGGEERLETTPETPAAPPVRSETSAQA